MNRTTPSRTSRSGGAGERARPVPTPSERSQRGVRVCSRCGQPEPIRNEAADLAVDWLVPGTASGSAMTARFHPGCRPAGLPGELACLLHDEPAG